MTTDYGKVLEWFGWKLYRQYKSFMIWDAPDNEGHWGKESDILVSPYHQAHYFDPYILEKGYWLSITIHDTGTDIEIWNGCNYIGLVYDKTEALAKREAYRKLTEVHNG